MSIQALGWAFRQRIQPAGAKFVLVALANYADEDGRCYPSQKTIATMTCQSERSVREHLSSLESLAVISRDHRRQAGGIYHTDVFQLHLDKTISEPAANLAVGESHQRQISPSADSAGSPAAKSAANTKGEDTKGREEREIPRTRGARQLVGIATNGSSPSTRSTVATEERKDPSVGSPSQKQNTRPKATREMWLEDDSFTDWYESYPHSVENPRRNLTPLLAAEMIAAIEDRPSMAAIARKLKDQAASDDWTKDGGKYVPSMKRYIAERMWERPAGPSSNRWMRDGHIYPIYVRGKGLTWPPGHKPEPYATQMSRVLDEDGNWIPNPTLY